MDATLNINSGIDLSTPSNTAITQPAATPFIFRLPAEIRAMILEFLLVEEEYYIFPVQVARRANKFSLQLTKLGNILAGYESPCGYRDPSSSSKGPETALNKSSSYKGTCRLFKADLALFPVFYKVNPFYFLGWENLVTFLAAITPVKRDHIQTVAIFVTRRGNSIQLMQDSIVALSQCKALKKLQILLEDFSPPMLVDGLFSAKSNLERLTGVKLEVFYKKRALERDIRVLHSIRTFDIFEEVTDELKTESSLSAPTSQWSAAQMVADFLRDFNGRSTHPKNETAFSSTRIASALNRIRLDVLGDGREGGDRKPNVVASRTRGQLSREKDISDIGVLPSHESKNLFTPNGAFTAFPFWVQKSRVTRDDSIEFLVDPYKMTSHDPVWVTLRSMLEHEEFFAPGGAANCISQAYEKSLCMDELSYPYTHHSLDLDSAERPVSPTHILSEIKATVDWDIRSPAAIAIHRNFEALIKTWNERFGEPGSDGDGATFATDIPDPKRKSKTKSANDDFCWRPGRSRKSRRT